jgi:hypothetical protein
MAYTAARLVGRTVLASASRMMMRKSGTGASCQGAGGTAIAAASPAS